MKDELLCLFDLQNRIYWTENFTAYPPFGIGFPFSPTIFFDPPLIMRQSVCDQRLWPTFATPHGEYDFPNDGDFFFHLLNFLNLG